ncbi:MAG: hypothetical protein E7291_07770 [Lachnospiraceae bacterium]|nr:hypothetical protein [Lachnospiraceae bacterium]
MKKKIIRFYDFIDKNEPITAVNSDTIDNYILWLGENTEATCTTEGEKTFTCEGGDTYNETIIVTGHTFLSTFQTMTLHTQQTEQRQLLAFVGKQTQEQQKDLCFATLIQTWMLPCMYRKL